jgi:CRP-like cAMP-binding protein
VINPLVGKLAAMVLLTDADRGALATLDRRHSRFIGPHEDIVREGDRPKAVIAILEGWACKYRVTGDGRRRIVGFVLPGDICDFDGSLLPEMNHSIASITRVTAAEISQSSFEELVNSRPNLLRAFQTDRVVNDAIQREWTINVGRRSASARLSHLLCELFFRLRRTGLVTDDCFKLPLSQNDLADALGLTVVCVNRTLQQMRTSGIIELSNRTITIPNLDVLGRKGDFQNRYLHLAGGGETGTRAEAHQNGRAI